MELYMKTIMRAYIYYTLLIMLTYIYNLVVFASYLFHKIISRRNTNHHKLLSLATYYYGHGYTLILRLVCTKIYVCGPISAARTLWISNHRSKLDGPVIFCALCTGGNDIVVVMKKAIEHIPIFGSTYKFGEQICIYRNKVRAEKVLSERSKGSILTGKSILIFPEGTTMSCHSKRVSDEYALANGMHKFRNVLIPRMAGFKILQQDGKFDVVGNITIRYGDPTLTETFRHSFLDLFINFPREIYLNLEYETIEPDNLHGAFNIKDKLLDQPINRNNYQIQKYSMVCMIFNVVVFVAFYYGCIISPFFRYLTMGLTIVSYIMAII